MSQKCKCKCGKCIVCDIERLRAIPAKWKQLKDPLAALEAIRNGEDYDLDEWLAREAAEDAEKSVVNH